MEPNNIYNRLFRQQAKPNSASGGLDHVGRFSQQALLGGPESQGLGSPSVPQVQRQGEGNAEISPEVEQSIKSKGGGQSMGSSTQSQMEGGFGADFSNVKIHTDAESHRLNSALNAEAFTHGNDIFFRSGAYQPSSSSGQKLLAHELTHVVQQNPAVQTKSVVRDGAERTSPYIIQRFPYWRGLNRGGSPITGTAIHNEVLDALGNSTSGLFTEAPVPNADRLGVNWDKKGYADLYKADSTVGMYFEGYQRPRSLPSGRSLRYESGRYSHRTLAAPQVSGGSIVNVGSAPSHIEVGDLKPYGALLQQASWATQLANYRGGFEFVANALQQDYGQSWPLSTGLLGQSDVTIPAAYHLGQGTGQASRRLELYDPFGGGRYFRRANVQGKLYVGYNPGHPGIWNYVWIPDSPVNPQRLPRAVTQLGDDYRDQIVDPLTHTPLVPRKVHDPSLEANRRRGEGVGEPSKGENKPKTPQVQKQAAADPASKPQVQADPGNRERVVRRRPVRDRFNLSTWQQSHRDLRARHNVMDDEDYYEDALANAKAIKAQEKLHDDWGEPAPTPATRAREVTRTMRNLEFWSNPLTLPIGNFRQIFGRAFVKFHRVYERLKTRIQGLARRRAGSGASMSIQRAAVKVIFRAFKMAGAFLVEQTVELLIQSLTEGVASKLQEIVEALTPEEVEEQVAELQQMREDLEETADQTVDDLLESLFGEQLAFFEDLAWIQGLASTISTIVSIIRWGIRIVECLSPPAVGCLWILLEVVADAIISSLMESCWFMERVMPVVLGIDVLRTIPAHLASLARDGIQGMLPEALDGIFAPIDTSGISADDFQLNCEDAQPMTAEQQALADLLDQIGEDRLAALRELLEKAGVGDEQPLTGARARELGEIMENFNEDQFYEFVERYPDHPNGSTMRLADFLRDVETRMQEQAEAEAAEEEQEEAQPEQTPDTSGGDDPDATPSEEGGIPSTSSGNARFDGEGGGGSVEGATVRVGNPSASHVVSDSPVGITIVAFWNGEPVEQVTGIPALVTRRVTQESGRIDITYVLQQGVMFNHNGYFEGVLSSGEDIVGYIRP